MNYWYFTYTWRCGSSRVASDGMTGPPEKPGYTH